MSDDSVKQTKPAVSRGLSEDETLLLTRTRSQELSGVEGIAVADPLERKPSAASSTDPSRKWPASTKYLLLFTAFITSLSFGVTQVPLIYVFRLMQCDAYYDSKAELPGIHSESFHGVLQSLQSLAGRSAEDGDRCALHAIESATAIQIAILGAGTTVFGIWNLFLTGALIKRIGIKTTLVIQIFFPAVRLFAQNVGVEVWGGRGIVIVQCSQVLTIIGGPSGYLLALNTFITEVVEHEGRTAALGRLTGSMMFGTAFGLLLGGLVAEAYGIKAPFRLTFALFLSSAVFAAFVLPRTPPQPVVTPADRADAVRKGRGGLLKRFFAPLAVFLPRKFVLRDGTIQKQWGTFLLACGVFLGILATGYLGTLLQLYATDVFGFKTKANGWLLFLYSALRGVFLTFIFPQLIRLGRQWQKGKADAQATSSQDAERAPLLATDQTQSGSTVKPKQETFAFDLTYTRFSLILDGILTMFCSLVSEGWQMYLVATILPFSAGTGSAAKGTVLQMVGASASSHERTDALAGVSLIENMARLSTMGVFGLVFAAFASFGRTELVFICNAAIALIGFGVLLFAHFPPEGSKRLDKLDAGESSAVATETRESL